MTKKIKSIPMVFAIEAFKSDVEGSAIEHGLTLREVSELAGRTGSYLDKLISDGRDNIEMNSFLSICNALDLDPRSYFVLKA